MGGAVTLFISLLWQNALCLDACASNFVLSDKILRIHRIISGLLFLQLVLQLTVIVAFERLITKKRGREDAEPGNTPNPHSPSAQGAGGR